MTEVRPTIAEQVNRLFESRWPGGFKSANTLVADFVSRRTGRTIDRQYIYRIRTGRVQKVDVTVLAAVAAFFERSLDDFASHASDADDELTKELGRSGFTMRGLAAKALSPAARGELARLVRAANDILERESVMVRSERESATVRPDRVSASARSDDAASP